LQLVCVNQFFRLQTKALRKGEDRVAGADGVDFHAKSLLYGTELQFILFRSGEKGQNGLHNEKCFIKIEKTMF
jgi:hypothetical protein